MGPLLVFEVKFSVLFTGLLMRLANNEAEAKAKARQCEAENEAETEVKKLL